LPPAGRACPVSLAPIIKHAHGHTHIDLGCIFIVGAMLVFAVATNVVTNVKFLGLAEKFPFIGVAVWPAIRHARLMRA
jgi:hypothetical protein